MSASARRLLAVLALALPVLAHASALDVVNDLRAHGCNAATDTTAPLKAARILDDVAKVNADGFKLAESLKRVGYRSQHSTSIHVKDMGKFEDALERVLRLHFCSDVTDARYREFGSTRRGKDVWIVLARPFVAPTPEAGPEVSRRMLELVNEARALARTCGEQAFAAAGPLRLNGVLEQAAQAHARDMAAHANMSHEGSDGTHPPDRATRAGYQWRAIAENVAAGQETPEEALQSWLKSPGHCANLMNPTYTEMGVAYFENPETDVGVYWAQELAAPRPSRGIPKKEKR